MREGIGAAHSSNLTESFRRLEHLAEQNPTCDRVCAELAKLFRVKPDEVALLRLEQSVLRFLFPPGLKTAGTIPVSGSAVAARTAATRSTLLSNSFAQIKHVRIFEDVKPAIDPSDAPQRMPIQKLMSVPVLAESKDVKGVIQVCRKGFDLASSGPDFTSEDLKTLEGAAVLVARMSFMQ